MLLTFKTDHMSNRLVEVITLLNELLEWCLPIDCCI